MDKVGLLRAYVKKFKHLQNEINKLQPGESISKESMDNLNQKGTVSCKGKKCCVPPQGLFKTSISGLNSSADIPFK